MLEDIKTILFATNLKKNCVPAFDFAAVLALRFQAKIILLHVLEKIPDYAESRIVGLLGEKQWNEIMLDYSRGARQSLIGKKSSSKLIQIALEHYCKEAGIDEASCGYQSREVVISDGNVVDNIIENSKKHDCNLIIMGDHEGLISKKAIGNTIKSILRSSKIPVLVVPSEAHL